MTALRGTTTATESSSTALTVPAVSGTLPGDLILIFAAAEAGLLGPAAGFRSGGNTQSGNTDARAYARTADGTEGSSFAITVSNHTTTAAAICAVYEGPASIDPAVIPAVYADGSNSASVPVPAITLADSGDWLAWFGAIVANTVTTAVITPPAGFTTQATIPAFNNGTDSAAMIFADLETAQAAGSTGTRTGTLSAAEHAAGWLAGISPSAPASAVNSGAFLDFFA